MRVQGNDFGERFLRKTGITLRSGMLGLELSVADRDSSVMTDQFYTIDPEREPIPDMTEGDLIGMKHVARRLEFAKQ